jgi:hypothetical protein
MSVPLLGSLSFSFWRLHTPSTCESDFLLPVLDLRELVFDRGMGAPLLGSLSFSFWHLHAPSTCESDFFLPIKRVLVIESVPNSFPLVLCEIRRNTSYLTQRAHRFLFLRCGLSSEVRSLLLKRTKPCSQARYMQMVFL